MAKRTAAESRARGESLHEGRGGDCDKDRGPGRGPRARLGHGKAARGAGQGSGGQSGWVEAGGQLRCRGAQATYGVEQVERAQAVLGAREAPAHHRGAWAGGRLRKQTSSVGPGG